MWQTIFVFGTVVAVQLLDNIYLAPVMIADKVKVHPVVAIVISLLGSQFYGALGLFFAIPVYIAYESLIKNGYELLQEIYGEGHRDYIDLDELR